MSAARGMKRASSGASGRARRVGNRVQRSTDASSSRVRSETDAYGTECARGVGGTGRTIAVPFRFVARRARFHRRSFDETRAAASTRPL